MPGCKVSAWRASIMTVGIAWPKIRAMTCEKGAPLTTIKPAQGDLNSASSRCGITTRLSAVASPAP